MPQLTIKHALRSAVQALAPLYGDYSTAAAQQMVSHALSITPLQLAQASHLQCVDKAQWQALQQSIREVVQGKPVEYVLQSIVFHSCTLTITPAVLIPRPETELLVEHILTYAHPSPPRTAWDVCCGSGCIGIALQKHWPQCKVSMSDISSSAIEVAKHNAIQNGQSMEILLGDLLTPIDGAVDLITCNPPYIAQHEFTNLPDSVLNYEPHGALLGGPTGLEYYHRLAADLHLYLSKNGTAFLELGWDQGSQLLDLFRSNRAWSSCTLHKDPWGQDRFLILQK
eukprot:NODE_3249_length_1002_cov_32.138286_g3103_i0.p1 GENE.NODE_3249_length_1002_cov_32.138286_g3103_i0~~NODE_3249_length_1002_cov_32.138286_g3103_i0.p1  ORF type:complete len:305 (+),score=100.71 NODE_3249_length_1002_cov_32.138286_g3103_i0:67-915(+)